MKARKRGKYKVTYLTSFSQWMEEHLPQNVKNCIKEKILLIEIKYRKEKKEKDYTHSMILY